MPFGLANAPATFQRWVNTALSKYLDVICIAYLDDLLIYSDTFEQHQKDVVKVLEKLREIGVSLKPTKCEFHKEETEYLGFIINREGVRADPTKTEAIRVWTKPQKVKDIQSFVGFCNFYRRFIEGFSRTAKPLYNLTKKAQKWDWGEKEQEAFEGLKDKLTTAPILRHFDPEAPIMIETDASNYVCSGIISQQDETGIWKPVAYRSKTMTKAECNYDIHDKELLAIMQALREWRKYAEGNPHTVKVITDHKNLVPFMTTKELNGRQIRWSEELSKFNIKIEYRPGKEGGKPDALTRRSHDLPGEQDERMTQKQRILLPKEEFFDEGYQTGSEDLCTMETHTLEESKVMEEIKIQTGKGNICNKIRQALESGEKEFPKVALGLCEWKNGCLYYDGKIWMPEDEGIRTQAIKRNHDTPANGHGGTAKTFELMQRTYYWPTMR